MLTKVKPSYLMPTVGESPPKHFPSKILIEILSRLPVRTLIRFTSVCKSWYLLIKDPRFIVKHSNLSSSYNTDNLLIVPKKLKLCGPNFYHLLSEETFVEYWKSEFPLRTKSRTVAVIGSCNGLVCLTDKYRHTFGRAVYLWNPSIKILKPLPPPGFCTIEPRIVLGFGFQESMNDFKIVRIGYNHNDRRVLAEVEIYSLGTDLWRTINVDVPYYATHKCMAFVGGNIHWLASGTGSKCCDTIMFFNFTDEIFGEILLPNDVKKRAGQMKLFVMGFKELLHLFELSWIPSRITRKNSCFGIWVMKEYGVAESWIKHFNVQVEEDISRPLCFTSEERSVILETDGKKLISCGIKNLLSNNPDDQPTGWSRIHGAEYEVSINFAESLVLFDKKNRYAVESANFGSLLACENVSLYE
ncbi:hypothetical protein NMG60_11017649 [Bertholletia excelsa]